MKYKTIGDRTGLLELYLSGAHYPFAHGANSWHKAWLLYKLKFIKALGRWAGVRRCLRVCLCYSF